MCLNWLCMLCVIMYVLNVRAIVAIAFKTNRTLYNYAVRCVHIHVGFFFYLLRHIRLFSIYMLYMITWLMAVGVVVCIVICAHTQKDVSVLWVCVFFGAYNIIYILTVLQSHHSASSKMTVPYHITNYHRYEVLWRSKRVTQHNLITRKTPRILH